MMSSLFAPSTEAFTRPETFGAFWDGRGTEFRIFAGRADRVVLCLFEHPEAATASHQVELVLQEGESSGVWQTRVEGAAPGTLYGYRVHGDWAPDDGLFYNPTKLLIDPWAKAVTGEPRADLSLLPFSPGGQRRNELDSARFMPKCVVVDDRFDGEGIWHPDIPWRDTVIYEAHVAGLTRLHGEVPAALRGTYLGLCSEPMIEHFRALGVTSIQLLPVHQAAPEAHLLAQGRRNYWGYAPVSFFAPSAAYATAWRGEQVGEFREMVQTLHAAGFEVLLDVVFNHTAEGGLDGPIYGLKGFDARAFYRWSEGRFDDLTGTGNTLDIRSPVVVEMVLESLRYWVGSLGVDGFRFDLAPIVGRDPHAFDADARLFEAIAADPLLKGRKWIAEPWDLGAGGYQLGGFPAPWSEWNDRFRDSVRRFWRGEACGPLASDLATRIAGSQDIFNARAPQASINYVTAHDGFTLTDLVSYEGKHNEANGEENRDGRDDNLSRNWGVEGPSEDVQILGRRNLTRRNLMAMLLLAQGVPMIAHGDELGRTQLGNNNVYCQDNELAWIDWSNVDVELRDFVSELVALRQRYGQLRCERFLTESDVRWCSWKGEVLESEHWQHGDLKTFSAQLLGQNGEPDLLLLINGAEHEVSVSLPDSLPDGARGEKGAWVRLLDTAIALLSDSRSDQPRLTKYLVSGMSVALFRGPFEASSTPSRQPPRAATS